MWHFFTLKGELQHTEENLRLSSICSMDYKYQITIPSKEDIW